MPKPVTAMARSMRGRTPPVAGLKFDVIYVSPWVNAKINNLHGLSVLDVEDACENRTASRWDTNDEGKTRLLVKGETASGRAVDLVLYPNRCRRRVEPGHCDRSVGIHPGCNTCSMAKDEEMTSEEFDAAFSAAEPVELIGNPVVSVQAEPTLVPCGLLSRPTDVSFGSIVVAAPLRGAAYEPRSPGVNTFGGVPSHA